MLKSIRNAVRGRRALAAGPADAGVAMIVVIGYGMVIMLIMTLLGTYAIKSMKGARREQDYAAAVAAAQAGADTVVALLRRHAADPAYAATLGTSPWTAVPGSVDATGATCVKTDGTIPLNCPRYRYSALLDPATGDVDIYSLGKTRDNVVRAIKVTAHQGAFTDYLYYSEVEAADPADRFAYPKIPLLGMNGAPAGCWKRAWPVADARPATGCQVPAWRAGDKTDKSRVHTNDVFTMTGNPEFNSVVTTAYDQCADATSAASCYLAKPGASPQFKKGDPTYSTGLDLDVSAPTNLKGQAADATGPFTAGYTQGCVYTGPTRIKFEGTKMRVWSPATPYTARCGGGPDSAIQGVINLLGPLLDTLSLSALLSAIPLAATPTAVDIPKNNVIYVKDNPATPNRVYCLLGKVAGLTGSLDLNLTSSDCKAGTLFLSGTLHGRVTTGSDGDTLFMTDLKYVDASGNPTKSGDNSLGVVAKGAVEVYNPVQCLLAVATCLSLDSVTSVLPFHSIEVDAAVMSVEHRFGAQLPILSPSLAASVLGDLVGIKLNPPTLKLFGSITQRYRGIIGADLLDVNVADLASVDVNIGYQSDFTYDQRLRDDPPPFFPKPASTAWGQDTFAEIPLAQAQAAAPGLL